MRTRRAISTIVGMTFAIIALTSTVTYIDYSMNIQSKYNQSVMQKNQQLLDIGKENFKISSVTVPTNGRLNITIANSGSLPVNITKIWVQNTTTTDWVRSYTPFNSFVTPGGTSKNIGQDIPLTINSANSYSVKLVTSRGNSQQFTMSSPNGVPLNIQLLPLPPSVPSGFSTQLVMTITNNGTSTLTNLTPVLTGVGTPTATCVPASVSPTSYATLTPGSTAIFSWSVKVTGTLDGQACTYQAKLQNGYPNNVAQATVTNTIITLSSTNYAANAGVITNDYTSFKWTQGNTWNVDWSIPTSGTKNDFQTTISNNNQTAGGYSLWLSKQSQIVFVPTFYNGNSVHPPSAFYLVGSVGLSNGQGCSSPYPCLVPYTDYSKGITNQGGIGTIYFGASNAGSTTQTGTLDAGNYYGFIILYGKFCINSVDNNCGNYAQTIPFYALVSK